MLEREQKAKISCPPRVVKKCEAGTFYFVPRTGLCQCLGTETSVMFETELDVVHFAPVESFRASEKCSIPVHRISESRVRELARKDEISSLFLRINNGGVSKDLPDYTAYKNPDMYAAKWESLLNLGNLDDYADIVVYVFKVRKDPPSSEIGYANRAMDFLAIERSVVMREAFKDSLELVKDVCGQRARTEELVRYGFTQRPGTPVITGPA